MVLGLPIVIDDWILHRKSLTTSGFSSEKTVEVVDDEISGGEKERDNSFEVHIQEKSSFLEQPLTITYSHHR